MAHGGPDLSDLLAVIEEPTVVPPLHQISSGQGGNLQTPMGASGFFSPTNLSFPTELNAQSQLGQIPELEHDLTESAFIPTDLHGHSFKNSTFQVENEDRGSLGSLFLSSIGHQLDSGKPENVPFVPSISLQDTSKIALSKPKQQNNSSQQMRNSGPAPQRSTGTAKSNYTQFASNLALSSVTDVGASGSALKSSNSALHPLPFISPTDLQPAIANIQPGPSQKKTTSGGQFAFPHGLRQQSLPTNPPRPHSATSNSSEHMSRPGSVQQPSPSCGSSHSGDPATPLTPQSYNAGTPQPYKPATPGNPSAIQQQRRPGFVDIHHSPQIPQVGSNQQTVSGYQPQTSATQSIISSNEALDDLPTPIKNAFDSIGNMATFHPQNDSIDNNNLWNPGSALMAPSALFVSTAVPQLQSNPVMVTPDQNLGFGLPGDMYGVNLPVYTSRVPRNEPSFEESLTPKQNEILNQLSAKGLKKPSAPSAGNESGAPVIQASNINTITMEMMNKANTAGTATVEKLLGSSQYEAISPVSDYAMSPTSKATLPEELTDNLYLSSKFSSEIDLPTSQQNQLSMNQDLTDPVMMYTTQKDDTHSQRDLPDLLGPEGVPDLISFPDHDWSTPISSLPSSQMQSSLTITSQQSKSNATVSHHGHVSSNRWTSNDAVSHDYGTSVNLSNQSGQQDVRLSDYAPTINAKITANSPKDTQVLSSQKQVPSQTMPVNSKDVRPFGMSRRKPSLDKTRVTTKSSKTTGQSDSAFGFESDDETETIRLIPPSSLSKKTAKPTQQPNFPPVKPRTMHPVGPSDELRQRMEAVKQLQQQQIRLQQIQAYQSQNASSGSSNITNQTFGRQFPFQNKAHLLSAGGHQPQYDTTHHKILLEPAATTSVRCSSDSTPSNSHLFGSFTSTNVLTPAKTLNNSAPLTLAQPNPSYADVSRYKTPTNLFQSEPQLTVPKSSDVQGNPYIMESIPKPSSTDPVDLLPPGARMNLPSVRDQEKLQATASTVSPSTISTSLSTFPSQIPQFSPPWKSTTVPPSIGLISTAASQQTTKVTVSPALPITTLSSAAPALLTDHSNLDWLHREPDSITSVKSSNSRVNFFNAMTRPSASEKNPTLTHNILNSMTGSNNASDKNANSRVDFLNTGNLMQSSAMEKNASSRLDFSNATIRSIPGEKNAGSRPDFLNTTIRPSASDKNPNSRPEFLNAMTRFDVGEKNSSSTFDVLNSTIQSSANRKILNSRPDLSNTMTRPNGSEMSFNSTLDLSAMTRSSGSEKNSSSRPDYLNNMSRSSASVSTSSHVPLTNSHHPYSLVSVQSSFSVSNTPLVSEDYLMPLKQSIHNVDHIRTPKTLPPIPSTFTPTTATKKHPANETRQINFKKHRILEGALPSTTTSVKSTPSISASSVFTTSSDANVSVACSVLDKQRRYLKEHSNSKLKHRTAQVQDTIPLPSNVTAASKEKAPEQRRQSSNLDKSDASQKSGTKQGENSGGMFELFSSLLKEASESAVKTRIELKETEPEKPVAKETVSKMTKSQPAPAPVHHSGTIKQKPDHAPTLPGSSIPTQLSSKSVTSVTAAHVVATTTSLASVMTSRSTSEIKRPAKKNWSSAIPFKRRYFDDTQAQLSIASKASVSVTSVMTSRLKPVVSLPKITVTTATIVTSTESVTSTQVKPPPKITLTTSSTTAAVVSLPVKLPPKISTTASSATAASGLVVSVASPASVNAEKKSVASPASVNSEKKSVASPASVNSDKKSVAAGSALKLRITAFRSSRGDIIHQSAMLSKDDDGAGSDRSSRKKSKKKKKKRDKKQRNDASSSDDTMSIPKADPREKLIEKAKLNEQITKELVELAKITSTEKKDPSKLSPQKRKRTRADPIDIEVAPKKPSKRNHAAKSSVKKKQDPKVVEPVARYLPKSVLQASSAASLVSATSTKTTVNIPATYQRAPGKLPLYLSSSDRKSSTAPTIQLVARTSTKVISAAAESKNARPSKPLSIKTSKTITSRSFSTQLLPNSNVQYIIPTTRSQPRVILPNVSTSTAVSVVSPLIVRSFPAGIVSLPTSHPNATAITKPQLFTFPVNMNESASNTLKSISAKISEKAKSRSEVGASTSSSCALVQSSVAKKSSPSVTLSTNSRSTTGLTGTLDTPRVTTKVLPPSIDQEANVNNFQSVFLKLITSPNPVPNYVPPDPPQNICQNLSENETFQCLACEDCFLFNESLEDHHARRSILIKVRCMQCDQDMVFLNKCKLLMHARRHSDGMQFNNAHISPLPLSMCKPRSKEWFLNNKKANNELTVQRQISSASLDSSSPTTPVVESPASLPTTLVCTECNFVAPTAEALEEHFQRTSTQASPEKTADGNKTGATFMCDICSVSVPNRCSFLAHMRMHKRAKPHTCPECGKMFNDPGPQEPTHSESKREIDFNFHLSIECFHLCRMTAYKCRICNVICKNAELLRRHLEDRHLQTFHKCLDCPMAFKTQENFASHQRSAHAVSPLTKMMYKCPKTIHKCPLCDTVFTDDNATQQLFLLQKHFEGHMSHPSINITAYKCLFCNDIFEKKAQVRDHVKTVHDVVASSDGDLNTSKGLIASGLKSNSSKKSRTADMDDTGPSRKIARTLLSAEATTSNARIATGTLGNRDSSRKKMMSPGDLAVGKKNALQPLKLRLKGFSPCVRDQSDVDDQIDSPDADIEFSTIASVESIIRDGRRFFPCGQCTKELPSASARVNHIRLKHQGIRTLFCCPYCPTGKIKFAKKISMKKHLKKIHGMDEVTKQDVHIEYVKLPIGQRFDRASLNTEEGTTKSPIAQKSPSTSTGSKVRKKFTRPGRKSDRPPRQARQDVMNPSLYLDNSDSEVERIMSNKVAADASFDKTEVSDEDTNFSKLKFPSLYRCAKCDHQCEDRLQFQAHIIEHKEDAEVEGITGMMQCTECGLCFASDSSHVKHLFIKHKIRKRKLLEKYDEQLKARRKAEGTLPYRLSEEFLNNPNGTCDSNVKKYKCTVCFKRFEEDTKLKSHMRTHGLAFVRSKHAS